MRGYIFSRVNFDTLASERHDPPINSSFIAQSMLTVHALILKETSSLFGRTSFSVRIFRGNTTDWQMFCTVQRKGDRTQEDGLPHDILHLSAANGGSRQARAAHPPSRLRAGIVAPFAPPVGHYPKGKPSSEQSAAFCRPSPQSELSLDILAPRNFHQVSAILTNTYQLELQESVGAAG